MDTQELPYVIVNGRRVKVVSEPEPEKVAEQEKPKSQDGKPIVLELTGDETVTITTRPTFPVSK